MFLSQNDTEFFLSIATFFSTNKLHALDEYLSKQSSQPRYEKIHKDIESILIKRGEKTLRNERLKLIKSLEKSLSISNPMGRFSANIIGIITKIILSKK